VGKDGCAVAVSLKVDTNIELLCSVVEVLDSGGRASNR
jgi:hypothetical protein